MSTTERMIVVSTVDNLHVGDEFESIPTHLTITPWFNLPVESYEYFNSEVEEIMLEDRFVPTSGGVSDNFGPDNSLPVRRLNAPDEFTLMRVFPVHARVFSLAQYLDPSIDGTYAGLNYAPHISDSAERAIAEDEVIEFNNLTVFEKRAATGRKLVRAIHIWENVRG